MTCNLPTNKHPNPMKQKNNDSGKAAMPLPKKRKIADNVAMAGLLVLAVAIAMPIATLESPETLAPWKWVYAAGAIIYTAARCVNVSAPGDSTRLRRWRRMQAWGGIAFIIAGAFWFYYEQRLGAIGGGALAILKNTILFTLVGAMLQIVSVWMIYAREKKESRNNGATLD